MSFVLRIVFMLSMAETDLMGWEPRIRVRVFTLSAAQADVDDTHTTSGVCARRRHENLRFCVRNAGAVGERCANLYPTQGILCDDPGGRRAVFFERYRGWRCPT
jgi:hypothetical protein